VLARLLEAGHEVALVLTQPDRRAGRGLRPGASAVKQLALERRLPLLQPETLGPPQAFERIVAARADALVVAAYGLILPQRLLDAARLGALNVHASLLPRWRGAAPIQRALLAGDRESGVSIMQMDAGLDTGPVFTQRRVALDADEDAGTLHDKLAALGAAALVAVLDDLQAGRARAAPQPETGVSYARKIDKREARLGWSRPALELERAVRAFRPVPGAAASLGGEALKIWRARVVEGHGAPGTLLAAHDELVVACGEQALAVTQLQRAGGRALSAAEFLRGRPVQSGARFE
jgi:methionyl-tRNA formyltransferase